MTHETMDDRIDALAAHASALRFEDLPDAVVAFQKRRVLDNIGTAAAGWGAAGVAEARRYARTHGGGAGARLYGGYERVSAPAAAFANAIAARALDYCDAISPGYHPSSTDVPVALAMAEVTGASGADVITALAGAQDLACRINLACTEGINTYHGFDSNVLAYFSGAAVAAKLLNLKPTAFRDALGHALNQAAGSFQSNQDKALAVRFIQGFASRASVDAALLAAEGVSAPRRILDGACGFFALYPRRVVHAEALHADLGRVFHGEEVTIFKLYPSCGVTLALTEAAFALRDKDPHVAERAIKVRAQISTATAFICGQPFQLSDTPEVNAMFSAEYVIVNAMREGASRLQDFSAEAVRARAVDPLFGKIELRVMPEFSLHQCLLSVETPDGVLESTRDVAAGFPQQPASDAQMLDKFRACFAASALGLPPERATQATAAIAALDKAQNAAGLLDFLEQGAFAENG